MPPRSLPRSIVLAGVAATLVLIAPRPASAQGLIDFLWGGSSEWGGGRQTVDFNPKYTPRQIIVSFGDRRLYLVTRKGVAISYPIAVPREQSRWQGTTTVSDKKVNPAWRPTPDMLRENPRLPSWVPGGHPMNPLGVRALYLGGSTYRIHGTDAPWTIGQAVSKGCIRMYNEDVLDLYPRAPVGMRVTVTWQRFATQSVASSYEETPAFGLSGYKSPPRRQVIRNQVIRNLPPLSRRDDAETATLPADFEPSEAAPPADDTGAQTKASQSTESKPGANKADKKAETGTTANSAATAGATSAAEAANKAAAAAAKAAEAAKAAAEVAKKAAADAKKASSADTDKAPEKAAQGQSAAL